MGLKVNQTELAEILGVSDVTLWTWQKEGMPVEQVNTRGLSNSYDTADVIAWYTARAVKKVQDESPRDALARAQTELVRMQVAERLGQLVPIADTEPGFARMVVNARQRLLQIPGLLLGVLDAAQVAAVEEQIKEALQELSRYDPSSTNANTDDADTAHAISAGHAGSRAAAEDVVVLGPAAEVGGGSLVGDEPEPERQDAVSGEIQAVDHALPA